MQFTKMHGLGNDFVFVEDSHLHSGVDLPSLAQQVCSRNFGIGADGFVIVLPSEKADARMRIFNPDGSEPEMCGNAIRCFAKYVYEKLPMKKDGLAVETAAGVMNLQIKSEKGKVVIVTVNMGRPRLVPGDISVNLEGDRIVGRPVIIDGSTYEITCVSMGNPHCVIFMENIDELPVDEIGPVICNDPLFPRKTNVEFVKVVDRKHLSMRVWERGVGETLACGTGACASAVAAALNQKTDRDVIVTLRGGDLLIHWDEKDDSVYMSGPAVEVFQGVYNMPE